MHTKYFDLTVMEAVLCPSSSIALILALLLLGSAEGDRSNGDNGPGFPTGDEQQCLNTCFFRNITSHRYVCGHSLYYEVDCNQGSKQVWLNSFYTVTYDNATGSMQTWVCTPTRKQDRPKQQDV